MLPFGHNPSGLWRRFSDDLYQKRFSEWLAAQHWQRALKTDLYDEAMSDGLYPFLQARAETVFGIDLLESVVKLAGCRHPKLVTQVGDARNLPFPDGHFGLVLSNSTLDHFDKIDDLWLSLDQLFRVLEPGGLLLISLDNAANPLIWLRRKIALLLGSPLPLMPYFPGPTLTREGLARQLQRCGFEVQKLSHWFHCPRLLAVQICAWLDDRSPQWGKRFSSSLARWEALEALPTAFLTGHYVVALARKPIRSGKKLLHPDLSGQYQHQ